MQKYPNPPITEAVIEIRVAPSEGMSLSCLEQIQSLVPGYPTRKVIKQVEIAGDGVSASTNQTEIGYAFASEEGKQSFMAGPLSFSFSRLSPYQGWRNFAEEASQIWECYRGLAKPASVTRIGLRFINRLDLPWPFEDFKEFLRTSPEVSPDMPQALSNFLMVLEIEHPDIKARMRLSQGNLPPVAENIVSILLDIDLFRVDSPPFDSGEIWEYLELMRDRKNEMFEACITDKTRELFR
ncbi:MAG: TIGR04255 family protein [Candidatus Obscuribacter sp.]|nr:TIGR04255 family protein [Candidatus Obscuribacter sp.]